jgi:hypothetical protein
MKITKLDSPYPAVAIDDFIPSTALLRAAAESFKDVKQEHWVKYGGEESLQLASKDDRNYIPTPALMVLDYIATHFDPNKVFDNLTDNVFPDTSYYAGGMNLLPNSNGEGGFLGMHIDTDIHGVNGVWKREYSAVLCVSEEYDSSFDLLLHDGVDKHARAPYKFNRLNAFKCSKNSWHGVPEIITEGLDRLTFVVPYWSYVGKQDTQNFRSKSKFRYDLEFIKN